jgi:hypothetical protein
MPHRREGSIVAFAEGNFTMKTAGFLRQPLSVHPHFIGKSCCTIPVARTPVFLDVAQTNREWIDERCIVRRLLKFGTLLTVAGILCGFDSSSFEYNLNAYRGQPVSEAIARLGQPIQTDFIQGNRLYYWRTTYGHYICKIWGIVDKQDIVVNWGYQDCAF